MNPAKRLREFIDMVFPDGVAAAADAMAMKRTTLYKYFRKETGVGGALLKRIAAIGGNPEWILNGEGEMFANNAAGRELRQRVSGAEYHEPVIRESVDGYIVGQQPTGLHPLFLNPAEAGPGQPAEDFVDEWIDPRTWLTPHAGVLFVRARGESMTGEEIKSGDVLVVDPAIEPVAGSIIVAAVDGLVSVKRVERFGNELWLMPANSAYEAFKMTSEHKLHVWGTVTNVVHRF